MNKHNARKTVVDGITFDSGAESRRYRALKMLEDSGQITRLELQPVFVLAPGVLVPGEKRKRPDLRYYADFRYVDRYGLTVVEDVKSPSTAKLAAWRIKRHLLALQGVAVVLVQ